MGASRMLGIRILQHPAFDSVIGAVILLNCATIGIELQLDKALQWFGAMEYVFLSVYMMELSLRFFAIGARCWKDNWINFDCVLVISGAVEQFILNPIREAGKGSMVGMDLLVILRILRLFRLARTFRLLSKFREMWILVRGVLDSGKMMVYTFLLLVIMLFIFACAGRELVGTLAEDEGLDPEALAVAEKYFSSVTVTMLTLVQFVCLDSIGSIYTPIILARPLLASYFLITVLVIGIVLMNLITAVIVNTAIEQAMEDKAVIAQTKDKKRKKLVKELHEIFARLDEDQSGEVTMDEVENLTDHDRHVLHECLQTVDPKEIFSALDIDGSGKIDIDEFIDGIWGIVASGSSMEMKRMEKQVDHMHKQLRDLIEAQRLLHDDWAAAQALRERIGSDLSAKSLSAGAKTELKSVEATELKRVREGDDELRQLCGFVTELVSLEPDVAPLTPKLLEKRPLLEPAMPVRKSDLIGLPKALASIQAQDFARELERMVDMLQRLLALAGAEPCAADQLDMLPTGLHQRA